MAWTHDVGYGPAYDHDGGVLPVLADHDETDTAAVLATAREHGGRVRGWRPVCSCGWRSEEVYDRADHPVADARAYLAPEDLADVPAPEWVAHVTRTLPELGVHIAVADDAAGRGPVESAVRRARAAGASWARIGRAAGITRQSAHERWAHLEATAEEEPKPAAALGRSFAAPLEGALAAAVRGLEERGPTAIAHRAGDVWEVEVRAGGGEVLGTAVLGTATWDPAAAGHRLVEAGWRIHPSALAVRGRAAGWHDHGTGRMSAPVDDL